MRWASWSWPPSKPGGTLPRAPVPLVPRPAVLPPLPAMPRPTRRLGRLEPAGGRRSWSFMRAPCRRDAPSWPASVPPSRALLSDIAPSEARRARRAWALRSRWSGGLVIAGGLHRHEMGHARQHAPDVGAVGEDPAAADAAQAQGPQRAPVLGLGADARAHLGHPQVAFGAGPRAALAALTSALPGTGQRRADARGRHGARRAARTGRRAGPAGAPRLRAA